MKECVKDRASKSFHGKIEPWHFQLIESNASAKRTSELMPINNAQVYDIHLGVRFFLQELYV